MKNKNLEVIFGSYWDNVSTNPFKKFKPTINEEYNSFTLNLTEKNRDKIISELANQISKKCYEIYFKGYLDKSKKFSEHDTKLILRNHLESNERNYYFCPLIKVILNCFLLKNNKINLTSFINFNIKGMREELENIATYEINTDGRYINAAEGFNGIAFIPDNIDPGNDIFDIISDIAENYYQGEVDEDRHKALLIHRENNQIILSDNKLTHINEDYYNKIAQKELGLNTYITDTSENKEAGAINSVLLSLVYLEVFCPKSLVIFGDFDEEYKEMIKELVESHNEDLGDDEIEPTCFYCSKSIFPRRIN